ncbi:hypothetical protein [Microlunatus sp. Gsoil 973]|uniref:hypothetical protein n=1 Tax=Microlunatus sp. Gsoil 973 TaxID=2672569 RepID=UPI0012B480F7|nr:hypothetical protein [Microlunatus sp. Gsoil 973]QGN32325.1 hypothetical protein GJV80_05440 [Microlunatus sp. Gsoil 973]
MGRTPRSRIAAPERSARYGDRHDFSENPICDLITDSLTVSKISTFLEELR